MNKNTFATVAAAAALAFGGIALAQSPAGTSSSNDAAPKSSTPGAGCTATGNAMSAGNLGGNATNKNCDNTKTMGAPAAATTTTTESTASTAPAAAPSSADTSAAAAPAPSTPSTANADTSTTSTTTSRVARADRG